MIVILVSLFIFVCGGFVGYFLKMVLLRDLYVGDIVVHNENDERTMYTLDVAGDLDNLQNMKEVLFKVVAADESLIRE